MPQAESNVVLSRPNTGAVTPDNRQQVDSTQNLERRADGSVWVVKYAAEDEVPPPKKLRRGYIGFKAGDVLQAYRVDSEQDPDIIAKGGRPWYLDELEAQEVEAKAEAVAEAKAEILAEAKAEIAADAAADDLVDKPVDPEPVVETPAKIVKKPAAKKGKS